MKMEKHPRPTSLKGATYKIETGCGTLHVTVNEDGGKVVEVLARLGKAGGCAACVTETLGRLVTVGLRAGMPLSVLTKQLTGITCHQQRPSIAGAIPVLSCSDAVGQILKGYAQ